MSRANEIVDMRSDTVTLPSKEMMDAIGKAELGDDVFGEDPTVKKLELKGAAMLGKEQSILVPSGTMANLISIIAVCSMGYGHGSQLIVGDKQHIYMYEQGGAASIAGVHSKVIKNQENGTLDVAEVDEAIAGLRRSGDDDDSIDQHFAVPKMIALENTHNSCGGRPLSLEYMSNVSAVAKKHGVHLHIDGARLGNAAVAMNIPLKETCKVANSVTLCLSKGLSAPIGSLIAGDAGFIRKCRRIRKSLGGGMRQAGIIAAAGIVALDTMVDRLKKDHHHASMLANGLNKFSGDIDIKFDGLRTNIIFFDVLNKKLGSQGFTSQLKNDHGILIGAYNERRVRAVTHSGVSAKDISYVLDSIDKVLAKAR